MIESPRRHGHSDPRYPPGSDARNRPRSRRRDATNVDDGSLPIEIWENEGGPAPTADELFESLDWAAFSASRFPDRGRHDLEALVAYARYRAETDARDPQSVAAEHDRGRAAT
jgi:hypothetical protein